MKNFFLENEAQILLENFLSGKIQKTLVALI
jgi:hypothetical protein